MFGVWNAWDMGCGMSVMWFVWDMGCMWYVRNMGCSCCGMFRMWDVWDVECEMFAGLWGIGWKCLLECHVSKF